MKKVALVTCYFQHNYGSVLQAYATQRALDDMGIANETICIDGFSSEIKRRKLFYFMSRVYSIDVIKDKYSFFKLYAAKRLHPSLGRDIAKRDKCFDDFCDSHFRLSVQYASINELAKDSHNYSAFLVGSDQLWLPSNIAADYYTLSFIPEDIRKISYATSFGVAALPEKYKKKAKAFLPRFEFVSVREQAGQKLVKEITDIECPVVCDPVFLLDTQKWDEVKRHLAIVSGKYIFCYFLGENMLSRKMAKKLKEISGYKIAALQNLDTYIKSDEDLADFSLYEVTPAEFVDLLCNAEYICTDSFHAMAFSIIYQKKFFSFRRFAKKSTMSTNNRVDSILQILGLANRIIEKEEDMDREWDKEIDYGKVQEKLSAFQLFSQEYLKKSLAGSGGDGQSGGFL